jgi:hypothetical protein
MKRRTALATGAAVGFGFLAGCFGGSSREPKGPPFADRIVFATDQDSAPVRDPWIYKERLTDGESVEELERPVRVVVFADQIEAEGYDAEPPEDQPARCFEIEEGRVVPIPGEEPTNDVYIVLKRRDEGATLRFIAKEAILPSRLRFDDQVLFDTADVVRGATFELPP